MNRGAAIERKRAETKDMPRKCTECRGVKNDVRSRPVPNGDDPSRQLMKRTCGHCADRLWLGAANNLVEEQPEGS